MKVQAFRPVLAAILIVFSTTACGNKGGATQASAAADGLIVDEAKIMTAGGVFAVPGKIQAEDFKGGTNGVDYYDTTPGNAGNVYRNTDVDVETCKDTGGGYNLAVIDRGEWTQYPINVATTGTYRIDARVASRSQQVFHLEIDGVNVTGAMTTPNTGSWQKWTTISKPGVNLTAGSHMLRFFSEGDSYNVNYFEFALTSAGQSVSSFSLVDASTGKVIPAYQNLSSGAKIDLAKLPSRSLSMLIVTSPATVGSVRVQLDGGNHIENTLPYQLCGGTDTVYNDCKLGVGNHVVVATPYSGASLSGTAGASSTLNFTIVDTSTAPTTSTTTSTTTTSTSTTTSSTTTTRPVATTTTTKPVATTTTTTIPVSSGSGWTMCPAFPAKATAADPEPPRVCIDTTPQASTRTVNVNAGDAADLQAKINAAQPGDELVLPAGSTYVGNFTLPNKSGSGWITIRTSNLSGIPAERNRVSSANASAMPKILTPNTSPAIATKYSAHNYRLVGLEVGIVSGVGSVSKPEVVTNLILVGDVTETSTSQLARDIVIDRCYIHGNVGANMRRGVAMNAIRMSVIDSDIEEAHEVGADSQALGGWSGAGPYKIVNNYLSGAAETLLFGGSDPSITNLIAEDLEIRQNYITKSLTWKKDDPSYGGTPYVVKNTLELKAARRVWIEGNVIENSWVMGQVGYLVVLTPRNQDGACTQCAIQDLTIENNLIRHGASGVNLLGTDNDHPTLPMQRVRIRNNLFYDIDGGRWSNGQGWLFLVSAKDMDSVNIDHNTGIQSGTLVAVGNANSNGTYDQATGFRFTNNIAAHNAYGIFGDSVGYGQAAINTYFPGGVFSRNVMVRTDAGVPSTSQYSGSSLYPSMTGTTFVLVDGWNGVGMMDFAGGDYRLSASSPFSRYSTDGAPAGAAVDQIEAEAAKATSGK